MGRGRAKAKQQKVARELKYSTHNTDLTALQRELSGYSPQTEATEDVDSDDDGEYADDADDELDSLDGADRDEAEFGSWAGESR
jgi:hypothetical protein